jgi:gluconate 5-dehydrogenase
LSASGGLKQNGYIIELRREPADRRNLNRFMEQKAWGAFRYQVYPSYDFEPIARKFKQEQSRTDHMAEKTNHPTTDMFDLTGKVAVVTGAARGIGRAIAEGLGRAGSSVVIADIDDDEAHKTGSEIAKTGVRAMALKCDVSRAEDADTLIRETVAQFGKVDILVNNAGISGSAKPVIDLADDEWHRTLAINLTGMFLCSRAAAGEMMAQKSGKIINITSIASYQPIANSADYCASKGGALMLTKVLALELVKHNIQVNAICPGMFDTSLAPQLKAAYMKKVKQLIPVGRFAQVDEIKGLAVFLASSASDYLVGAAIPIDGGISIRG